MSKVAKPTLLFMQIILYYMTYIHYYNKPGQATCCLSESPQDPLDDHIHTLGNLQLLSKISPPCTATYCIHSDYNC